MSRRKPMVFDGDRVRIEMVRGRGQTDEEVLDDLALAASIRDLYDGADQFNIHWRTLRRVRVAWEREVGPPPWRWPRARVRGHRWTVKVQVGWRMTAMAVWLVWLPKPEHQRR